MHHAQENQERAVQTGTTLNLNRWVIVQQVLAPNP